VDRIKNVKKAAGVTLNDVVLAMCSGALRYYLLEQDALPDMPLHAMVPVSLRREDEADAGGNLVGAILCNLATDTEDPAKRLEIVSESMYKNKTVFSPAASTSGLGAFGDEYECVGSGRGARLGVVDVAAVQPDHFERAGTRASSCTTGALG